jgi:hypothetical protein
MNMAIFLEGTPCGRVEFYEHLSKYTEWVIADIFKYATE